MDRVATTFACLVCAGLMVASCGDDDAASPDAVSPDAARLDADADTETDTGVGVDVGPVTVGPYVAETRTIAVAGEPRTFVLARPDPSPAGLPLVIAFHGDGETAAELRSSLALEAEAATGVVVAWIESVADAFEYWSYDGRTREVMLVTALVERLAAEIGIDAQRVFLTGFSGGAVMTSAVACRLGAGVIRAVGISSGSLYSIDGPDGPEFTEDASGAASCGLPAAILVWGTNDESDGTEYDRAGLPTRDLYVATAGCAGTTSPFRDAPCVAYDGCAPDVVWCSIDGLDHDLWSGAAHAIWRFFDAQR